MLETGPRRLRFAALLPLLPFILVFSTACAGSDSGAVRPQSSAEHDGSPAVTVTWSFWGDDWEKEYNARIARAFEREHSGIKVELVHQPWAKYFDWLRGEWKAGHSPDVMFLNYIPSYVAINELEPLDRYVERDALRLDDFYPALLDSFRSGGKLYGFPRDNDTKVIYYNRAHFAEAGIPTPAAGWTWDDLRAAALKLTRQDGAAQRYGFGFEPDFWWLVWMWQHGGDMVNDPYHPTASQLEAPAVEGAVRFLHDLIHVDRVTPPPAALNTDEMSRLFRDGRLSMLFGNHTLVPWFTETRGLAWDVAPLPRDAARANVAGGAGYVVSRRSQQKDAAWQLVRYLTSPKAQAMLAESGVITPARRSVREDNIFLRQQGYRADVFLSETELGRPVPNFPGVTDIYSVVNAGLAPVWKGDKAPAAALAEIGPRVRQMLGLSP